MIAVAWKEVDRPRIEWISELTSTLSLEKITTQGRLAPVGGKFGDDVYCLVLNDYFLMYV